MATSPASHAAGRTRRKITVNERVERILLHGDLQGEEPRTATAEARDEQAMRRSRQLSSLYVSSTEDRFVRSRISQTVSQGAQSVPKNAHLGRRGVSEVPPIVAPDHGEALSPASKQQLASGSVRPVKCYAKFMLEQLTQQDKEERIKVEARQFPPPDFSPPKPWYKGYSSHIKTPSCTVDAKVKRYGAYGAVKMLARETTSGTVPPFVLRESQSLDSLAYKNSANAWSPTLHGSPTLWPENANYAHGSKLQTNAMSRCPSPEFRFPSHVVGRNELPMDDKHFQRMVDNHTQDARQLEVALDEEKRRRRQEIAYNKDKFEHWKSQLHFEPLSSKVDHPFMKVNAKRAKELTILHNPEYSTASKYHKQAEKLTHERFTLRWRSLSALLDVMKKTPCRRPVLQDIEKLFALSYEISLKNLNHLELNRQQFWELMVHEYPQMDQKHVNRVFSSYDCRMEDRIDMRLFLATVRALRIQQGAPIEIFTMGLQDFDITKRQMVTKAAHFVAIACMCSGSEDEDAEMRTQAQETWARISRDFAEEKETRRVRRLRGLDALDEEHCLDEDESWQQYEAPAATSDEDEAQSEMESLLFIGRDDEPHAVPIKFVRHALREEKKLLHRFTDVLVRRREECYAMAAAAAKARASTPVRKG